MQDELPPPSGPSGFLIAVSAVGVLTIGFALLLRSAMAPAVSPQIGRPFPRIEAVGWINGPGPTADDLQGKVVRSVPDGYPLCHRITQQIQRSRSRLYRTDIRGT